MLPKHQKSARYAYKSIRECACLCVWAYMCVCVCTHTQLVRLFNYVTIINFVFGWVRGEQEALEGCKDIYSLANKIIIR